MIDDDGGGSGKELGSLFSGEFFFSSIFFLFSFLFFRVSAPFLEVLARRLLFAVNYFENFSWDF